MRKTLLVVVAILAAVAAAAYAYYRYSTKPDALTVNTARVTRGDIAETVGATGQLQAVTTVQVGTQVSGTIQDLQADFNSLVRKGQVLARLDPSLFQTQIEQARANLIRAQADLERLRVGLEDARTKLSRAQELWEGKLIARTELEAAEVATRSAEAQLKSQQAAVTQSQASLSQNEVNLQHTIITSPIDGLVISRNVDVGQTVAASMSAPTLFVLAADLTKMQVLASLDEADVGRIRPGQTVRFRVDAFPNEEFLGAVTQVRLQPTTVQNVVTYQTVIDVPNPALKLKPGMTANVNIEIARRSNVLRVPNTALRFRPTTEIFEALGQTPPPTGGRGRGAGAGPSGASPDTRSTTPGSPATSEAPGAAAQRSERNTDRGAMSRPQPSSASPSAQSQTTPAPDLGSESGGDGTGGGRGNGRGWRGGRGNFAERMASLTPEERERFLEKMRARGITPPAELAQPPSGAKPAQTPRAAGRPESSPSAAVARGAPATFDALFGPLAPTESFGQAWLSEEGKIHRVRMRLGISDGQQTELIQVLDGDIKEGTDVVTSILVGPARQTPTPAGGNAFPGLGGGRGFGGGGGRGGRGGG